MISQFEKQPIELDCLEAEQLAMAIYQFLVHETQARALTEQEILSITPLSKVNKRLVGRVTLERMKPKPKPFIFKLRYDEVLAIHWSIKSDGQDLKLQVALGKVQQKALNLIQK